MNIRRNIIIILFISMIILIFLNKFKASSNLDDFYNKELFNETNTYNFISYENSNNFFNLNEKNNNVVDKKDALLTFFIHGLEGNSSHWSFKNKFDEKKQLKSYLKHDSDSLINRIYKKFNSNVYLVKVEDYEKDEILYKKLLIYDYTKQIENFNNKYNEADIFLNNNLVSNIKDISKHSIFIFEATLTASKGTNDEVYKEFNYASSKIIKDIKKLNNNILPKINLIGHSRGGLTALQYALDHPDLVQSIYTLGTPFFGTTTGNLEKKLNFLNFSDVPGFYDIINKEIYKSYYNRWNKNYERLYKNINVMALGGYSTLENLRLLLKQEKILEKFRIKISKNNKKENEDINRENQDIVSIYSNLTFEKFIVDKIINYFYRLTFFKEGNIIEKGLTPTISIINEQTKLNLDFLDSILKIFTKELNFTISYPFFAWENDGFVDLSSQLGIGKLNVYKGFKRIKKVFNLKNFDINKTSNNQAPIVHNLEARDYELGTYIVNDIKGGKENIEYEIYEIDNNSIGINSYIGDSKSYYLKIPKKNKWKNSC